MVLFMLVAISAKSLEKYIYVNDTQRSRYLCWTLNSATTQQAALLTIWEVWSRKS